MRFIILASIASAVLVAATPQQPPQNAAPAPAAAAAPAPAPALPALPDCPPAIIALLPGCIATPSDTCFDSAPTFPQKCIDAIKKAYPTLAGLPATGR